MENTQTVSKRNIPRDVFLHLLAIVTLYWSSTIFITLLWQFINYFFPGNFNLYYSAGYSLGMIRFAVSSLFVVFPLFIFVSWYLNKIYKRESAVRESKIRKWLLYLTLFVAALVVIGDLVAVINNLLGGETTAKFVLKAFSILLVAGFVFGYYLDDVRREIPSKLGKYFAWVSGGLVFVAIIGSFFIIGSPSSARLVQYDQQKIADLQNIQSQIVNYWQRKDKMPDRLADLNDSISGFVVPTDSQTGASYEYNVKGTLEFELCAVFNKVQEKGSADYSPVYYQFDQSQNWEHGQGRVCFDRTIDEELYILEK